MKTLLTVTALNLYTIIPFQKKLLKFSGAIFARAYFKNHYVDLLDGSTHAFDVTSWIETLDFKVLGHHEDKRFIHLFYELGFLFEDFSNEINDSDLLGMDIQYSKKTDYILDHSFAKINLKLVSGPTLADYKKRFLLGLHELNVGNCYQFNLTGEYQYSFPKELSATDFINALWRNQKKRGAYASATYVEAMDKLFLSNSPECLFEYREGELVARPIKGTLKRQRDGQNDDQTEIKALWSKLTSDAKSQGELYMISDLLRNDLSRIDLPKAFVAKKKAILLVPGLIHQYSEIKVKVRSHVTLKNILEKIFPGGSITGTPKKRTIKILRRIEERSRGFYCGSTLFFSPGSVEASINIRASVIDFKNNLLSYQAGGGITLMSEVQSEFEEMTYKRDSYIDMLTL